MVEVPLLFEVGRNEVFDTTVAVVTADEVRRERAEARGHALVDEREARQLSQAEKAKRAEHVVANDGRRRRPARARARPPCSRNWGDEEEGRFPPAPALDRPRHRRGCVGLGAGLMVASGAFDDALQELTLPLRHEDVIRQQADEKGVDAALIAAVIYSESKFEDQT